MKKKKKTLQLHLIFFHFLRKLALLVIKPFQFLEQTSLSISLEEALRFGFYFFSLSFSCFLHLFVHLQDARGYSIFQEKFKHVEYFFIRARKGSDWDILISIRYVESKLGVIHKAEVVYSQTILVPSHTQINKAMPCYLVHLNFCYMLCT